MNLSFSGLKKNIFHALNYFFFVSWFMYFINFNVEATFVEKIVVFFLMYKCTVYLYNTYLESNVNKIYSALFEKNETNTFEKNAEKKINQELHELNESESNQESQEIKESNTSEPKQDSQEIIESNNPKVTIDSQEIKE